MPTIESHDSAEELPGPEGGVLADLTWLVGTWRKVEVSGAVHEVHWGPSYHRSMAGTMRSIRAGRDPEYVFLVLAEDEAGVRLHYHDLGRGDEAAETKLAVFELADRGKGWVSFKRVGQENPHSVEFRLEEGELQTWFSFYDVDTGYRYSAVDR